ncbi:endonuclease/exonuclease/phosphatase family protein [Erythrobacter sp. MTPC3]|uniref:endonuclease/exonuclease/phosphatase family protein n=1 Tax=Erythrobacter sp. MTPC3 TaxID=3056564 RepID=UPI0036F2E1F1
MRDGDQPTALCESTVQPENEISVLTYNVKGLPWPLASGREEPLRRIASGLHELCGTAERPHVVVLQEAFGEAADDFIRQAGYRHVLRGPNVDDAEFSSFVDWDEQFFDNASAALGEGLGRYLNSGLVILSDRPIELVAKGIFPQEACAGYDCLASKGIVLARVSLGEDLPAFVIGNIHMNAKNSSGASPERQIEAYRRQVDLATEFVSNSRDPQLPFVFAGDFNMGTVEARRDHLFASGLHVRDENDGLRVLASQGQRPVGTEEVIRHGADYQFYFSSPQWSLEPLTTSIPFGRANANKELSDHIGFMVTYRLTPATVSQSMEAQNAS